MTAEQALAEALRALDAADEPKEWDAAASHLIGTARYVVLEAARLARTDTGELARLREAAQAYIDWRDKRAAQWETVARHDHEHGIGPCPEWDELTSEPFDIDQRLDDAIRAALIVQHTEEETDA